MVDLVDDAVMLMHPIPPSHRLHPHSAVGGVGLGLTQLWDVVGGERARRNPTSRNSTVGEKKEMKGDTNFMDDGL